MDNANTTAADQAQAEQAKQAEAPKSVKLTYMPNHYDNDETVVDGVTFKAYEPVEVDGKRDALIEKLKGNPFFTAGEVNADRKAAWQKVRDAQKQTAEHKNFAEQLERDPVGAAALLEKAGPAGGGQVVQDAQRQADAIIKAAHEEADRIVADARAKAASGAGVAGGANSGAAAQP